MDVTSPEYQRFIQSLTPEQKEMFIAAQQPKTDKEVREAQARARIANCDRRSLLYAKIRQARKAK